MSEQETVKIGQKQKHLKILTEYIRVTDGIVKKGDYFTHLGSYNWEPVDTEDIGCDITHYDCLIRHKKNF